MKLMLASVRVVLFFAADRVEVIFNLECSCGLYCSLHDKAVYYTDTGECRGHKNNFTAVKTMYHNKSIMHRD